MFGNVLNVLQGHKISLFINDNKKTCKRKRQHIITSLHNLGNLYMIKQVMSGFTGASISGECCRLQATSRILGKFSSEGQGILKLL